MEHTLRHAAHDLRLSSLKRQLRRLSIATGDGFFDPSNGTSYPGLSCVVDGSALASPAHPFFGGVDIGHQASLELEGAASTPAASSGSTPNRHFSASSGP